MHFINVTRTASNEEFFIHLIELEKELEVEFLIVDAKGEETDYEYINDSLVLKDISTEGKKFVVIYLYGKCPEIIYENAPFSPAISYDNAYFEFFDRGSYDTHNRSQNIRGDAELYLMVSGSYFYSKNYSEKTEYAHRPTPRGIKFVKLDDDSIFSIVRFPKEDNELDMFPSIYVNYNFINRKKSTRDIVGIVYQNAFNYVIDLSLYVMGAIKTKPVLAPLAFDANHSEEHVDNMIEGLLSEINGGARDKLSHAEQEVNRFEQKFVQSLRIRTEYRALVAGLQDGSYMKEQLAVIEEDEDVLWVRLSENELRFMTRPLTIISNRKKYPLGNMLITVQFSTGKVYFDNASRRRLGYNGVWQSHPHDMGNDGLGDAENAHYGYICLGEIQHYIPKMISDMEIGAMVKLLINFATSVNTKDTAGKHIKAWVFQ